MRLAILAAAIFAAFTLPGCMMPEKVSRYDPRYPTQTGSLDKIDPYHRDKVPDTPYEVRKGEIERDDQLAGRTGPTYPPLFKNQKKEDDADKGGS